MPKSQLYLNKKLMDVHMHVTRPYLHPDSWHKLIDQQDSKKKQRTSPLNITSVIIIIYQAAPDPDLDLQKKRNPDLQKKPTLHQISLYELKTNFRKIQDADFKNDNFFFFKFQPKKYPNKTFFLFKNTIKAFLFKSFLTPNLGIFVFS